MSENLEPTRPTPQDEVESARILFQENLIEEAKKILHRLLIAHPAHVGALTLLGEIRKHELATLKPAARTSGVRKSLESPDEIISSLERDLNLEDPGTKATLDPSRENWVHPVGQGVRDSYDLGIAFFEMGFFQDALLELREAYRVVRVEQTSLDEAGVSIAALIAECQIELGEAFEAGQFLGPILSEPELTHEAKIPLFYLMGRAEERMGHGNSARSWYEKALELDPFFRDADFRIRHL